MAGSLTILMEQGWGVSLLRGAGMTALIAVVALFVGLVIGLAFALIKWGQVPILRRLVDIYTLIIRGVPEILIIYVFFFASDDFMQALGEAFGYQSAVVTMLPTLVVIVAVGLIASSYSTETIRGALNAVPRGLIEASAALGFTPAQRFRYVILPQAMRYVLPGINNIWQNTIKDTALVSLVTVAELLYRAQLGANSTGRPFLFYACALILYMLITIISQYVFSAIERHLARHGGRLS